MLDVLKMAARNTLRNKRRTILTELMIIIGVVFMLFTSAFLQSMSRNWRDAIVSSDLGYFQIMHQGYKEKRVSFALDYAIQDVNRLVAGLSKEHGIVGVSKRITVGGLISSGKNSSSFFARGVDTGSIQTTLPKIYGTLVEGKALSANDRGKALLGEGLAKLLNVKIGDVLMLATYDKYKAMNAVDITVKGIMKIPEEFSNNSWVLTDYQTAGSLVSFGNEATEIVVRTSDFSKINEIMGNIKEKYSKNNNLEFYTWSDLAGSFNQAAAMFALVSMVISVIIYVAVLIGLTNTILMSVFERTSEIGTLMALGASRLRVMGMFIAESIWLGIFGVIIGVLIHFGIISLLSKNGIKVPPPPGSIEGFTLYPLFNWNDVISAGIIIIVVAVLAAVYPARFASKLNPVEAIRSI